MLKTLIVALAIVGLINGVVTALTSSTPKPTAPVLVACQQSGC